MSYEDGTALRLWMELVEGAVDGVHGGAQK